MNAIKVYKVKKLKSKNTYKELTLNNALSYVIPYSSCIDRDCTVLIDNSKLSVECRNGNTIIFPTYCKKAQVKIGGFSIDILIKEITDQQELESYDSLAKYHYKEKTLFGRTSILVATNTTPYLPKVIGYIELATPFYVNKPRAEILNAPFKHNGISWNAWDKATTKKYINTIVRIARCVVYPEFRGVGLGKILVEHAEIFAKERWQISKLKPLFLEISADMLRYVPFAEKAGMHYVGETEGNLNRIHKDLEYLLKNRTRVKKKEIVSNHQMGIVEQQKSRLRKAIKLAKDAGITIKELIIRLKKLSKDRRLKDFTFFNGLVSLPKPTYIKGLDAIADSFIIEQVTNVNPLSEDTFYRKITPPKFNKPIVLNNLNISYSSSIRRTRKTQAIHNAFGISPSDITAPIIHNLNLTIQPGEIVFVTGSSGAGKTTLLNFFAGNLRKNKHVTIGGKYKFPIGYKPGEFQDIKSEKALVEYFADEDITFALQLMGNVGLSDAHVFVKRFHELSKGQQYRALMAKLIHSKSNVLIVDEFCSNLDPITANVLAHRMHKLVKRLGLTLIIGAAHCESFIKSLSPDKVVRLSTAWDYEVLDGRDFTKQFRSKNHSYNAQSLLVQQNYFEFLLRNKKNRIILNSASLFKVGVALLESTNQTLPIYINKVDTKKIHELKEEITEEELKILRISEDNSKGKESNMNRESEIAVLDFSIVNF